MIEKYFTDSFDIKSETTSKFNGVAKTTYTTSTGKKGKIDPLTTAIVYQNGSDRVIISHKLFTFANTSVKEKDIIIYGGKEFNVISVLNPFSKGHHLEVLLESRY